MHSSLTDFLLLQEREEAAAASRSTAGTCTLPGQSEADPIVMVPVISPKGKKARNSKFD